MSKPYTIQSGDTLTGIAAREGFSSWRDIYYHAENAAFRAKRPNPDRIFAGDVIVIPAKSEDPPGQTGAYDYCGNESFGNGASPNKRDDIVLAAATEPVLVDPDRSPRLAALKRVSDALTWIRLARDVIRRANVTARQAVMQPAPILEWNIVNAHFRLKPGPADVTEVPGGPLLRIFPGTFLGPIITNGDYLNELDRVYARMSQALNRAGDVFKEILSDPTHLSDGASALTLTKDKDEALGFFGHGIFFTNQYPTRGPMKQTEIAVHECSHFVKNDLILDRKKPFSDRNPNQAKEYAVFPPAGSLPNAYSYSQFALHCVLGVNRFVENDE